MTRNRSLWTVGLMIFLAAVYFYQDPEWNGNSRLDLTRAIVEQGSFQIDRYFAQHDWTTEDTALFDGHYYSDKAIGSSLLAVPFYFLIYHIANVLHLQLGSALDQAPADSLGAGPGACGERRGHVQAGREIGRIAAASPDSHAGGRARHHALAI